MRELLRSQTGGVVLMMALAFMVLGVPVVTGILRLSDTLASDSRVKTNLVRRDYCGLAAVEYVRFIALDETRWDGWWDAPGRVITAPGVVPVVGEEILNIGGCDQVSFRLQLDDAPGQPPIIAAPQLQTTKTVNTSTSAILGQVTYTIVVTNPGSSTENLTTIYDGLPLGFDYLPGTTLLNGQPFGDPTVSIPIADDDEFCIFETGNLNIAPNANITCSVGANDNVFIGEDAYIGGNVVSLNGNVVSDEDVEVLGDVEASSGNITLGDFVSVVGENIIVRGDVRAGGNVTLGENVIVYGDVRAGGNVYLGETFTVYGNIRAGTGNVTLGEFSTVGGDVVAFVGNVTVPESATLAGDIWAGGNVDLGESSSVDRNVWALGNVILGDTARVGDPITMTGEVIAGGNVTLGTGAQVWGGYTESCQVSNVPPCYIPPIPAWALIDGEGERPMLTWDVSNAGVSIPPGGSATLTFTAQVSSEAGNYCNQSWVDPGSTGSGLTAKVTVGSPSGTLCADEKLVLTTTVDPIQAASNTQPTFTYTTTVLNNGPTKIHFRMIRQKLPPGFSYTVNSAIQLVAGSPQFAVDPSITTSGGRQRLTWYPQPFADEHLYPGVPKTLIFQATPNAPLAKGDYRAESWAFFREIDSAETPYTFPTALIRVRDPFEGTATDSSGRELVSYEAWLGTNSSVFNWTIR